MKVGTYRCHEVWFLDWILQYLQIINYKLICMFIDVFTIHGRVLQDFAM